MVSVTQRIKEIKQPHNGYINPKKMITTQMGDGKTLRDIGDECVYPSIVGMAVDYLTRWKYSGKIVAAFHVSLLGARCAGKMDECMDYLNNIKDLSDKSIENACRAVNFDVYFRAGKAPSKESSEIYVDHETCENIRIMVNRGMTFFEKYGPITSFMFGFGGGGYTKVVDSGDGDFLTRDTLWDFKVSVNPPTSKNTLQLMMYYIMGKHSSQSCFETINNIGIFNPRLNRVYTLDVRTVDKTVIEQIEKDVICY